MSCCEAECLLGVEHCNDAQRAALAVRPAPRKSKEGATLARDLIDIAADVLDARDSVGHHDRVRGLPVREILDTLAPRFGLVSGQTSGRGRTGRGRPKKRSGWIIRPFSAAPDGLPRGFAEPLRGLFV